MDGFLWILAALVASALSFGISFTRLVSPYPSPSQAAMTGGGPARRDPRLDRVALILDALTILLLVGLLLTIWQQRPDVWFLVTALALFLLAIVIKALPRRDATAPSSFSARLFSRQGFHTGATAVGFIALAAFSILTRPPCPPAG